MVSEEISSLRNACIIAAHPDDEILWFSSIASRVSRVFVCYLGNPSRPKLGQGRQTALKQAPLHDFVCIGLDEADVYDLALWPNPEPTHAGLELVKARDRGAERRYNDNFARLVESLSMLLQGFDTVFTHNPWGEYGHEEHVQVYRAVRSVQAKLGFSLWCSAYVSSRSRDLMARCLDGAGIESFTLDTNRAFAHEIASIYKEAGVWTWFDNYTWPEWESFLHITPTKRASHGAQVVPLHYLNMGLPLVALADRSLRSLAKKTYQYWPFASRGPIEPI